MADIQRLLCEAVRQVAVHGRKVTIPAGGDLLWRWFCDLSRTRTYSMNGPNPVSFSEIEAYARLYQLPIEPRHVASLRAMDETFLDCSYQKREQAPEGVKTLPPKSHHAMTAGMFDAIFGRHG